MISKQMIANAEKCAWLDDASDHAPTAIANLTIYSAQRPAASMPALFEPRFYVLLQGAKRMRIAGQDMIVRPGQCAISTLGPLFHTEVVEASPARPYLGVAFAIDVATLADLLLAMPVGTDEEAPAFTSGMLTDEVAEVVGRLLGLLAAPADIPFLAPLSNVNSPIA